MPSGNFGWLFNIQYFCSISKCNDSCAATINFASVICNFYALPGMQHSIFAVWLQMVWNEVQRSTGPFAKKLSAL